MSRLMTLRSRSDSGMSPLTMRWARPSTIAVLPTPGSPISTGLFFVRRDRTWMTRRISSSRPMTGSSLPSSASCVRSRPNFCSDWYLSSGLWSVTRCGPRTASIASSVFLWFAPLRLRIFATSPACAPVSASRMCSVEMYSSLSLPASRSARRRMSISSRLVRRLLGAGGDRREASRGGPSSRRGSRPGGRRACAGRARRRSRAGRSARRAGARAASRCAGGRAATAMAACNASWDLIVKRSACMCS